MKIPKHNHAFNLILADDDEDDRLFFKEAISDLKIDASLQIVNDGTQLINYLIQNEVTMPGLVFLDINMPGKSGLKILEEIRQYEKLKGLFIAIYSTSTSPKDVKSALEGGADVYIKKPSDYDGLKKILSKAILSTMQNLDRKVTKENFILTI